MTAQVGATWTTDAPFRETAEAITAAQEAGILAVEMEAAALYAFAAARNRPVVCFAHVTNQMGRIEGDFENGVADGAEEFLNVISQLATSLARLGAGMNVYERWVLPPLLGDSGVGRQQHMIIGQGQLDGILSSNPENRRAVIEEAAGVLKHRRRKERSERRLAATQENLERLGDLVREVRRQMRPLERQAASARTVAGVEAELRDARATLFATRIARYERRRRELDVSLDESAAHERELRAELVALDAQATAAAAEMGSRREESLAASLATVTRLAERARGLTSVIDERRRALDQALITSADENVIATLEADAPGSRATSKSWAARSPRSARCARTLRARARYPTPPSPRPRLTEKARPAWPKRHCAVRASRWPCSSARSPTRARANGACATSSACCGRASPRSTPPRPGTRVRAMRPRTVTRLRARLARALRRVSRAARRSCARSTPTWARRSRRLRAPRRAPRP